jgi:2',3'-cyclic-nucleotide 2'-phosphodiesterase
MRILFIGDVVGKAGVSALSSFLPPLRSRWSVDVTIVNGENSADGGFGITRDTYKAIRDAGADVVTLGNHSWARKEALELANQESRLIRPINYVPGAPGSGLFEMSTGKGKRALVINALGRLFMEPSDDPLVESREFWRCIGWGETSMRSCSTSTAKRPEKSRPWAIFVMGELVL